MPIQIGKMPSIGTGKSFDNNLSIRGQLFEKIPVRLSVGRFQQEGIRLTSEFVRNSAIISFQSKFFDDRLRINLNANFSRESNRFADGVEGAAIAFDPTQPVFDAPTHHLMDFLNIQVLKSLINLL